MFRNCSVPAHNAPVSAINYPGGMIEYQSPLTDWSRLIPIVHKRADVSVEIAAQLDAAFPDYSPASLHSLDFETAQKLIAGLLLILSLTVNPASADPPACLAGFVNREAHPDDHMCVTPASKARAQAENAVAPLSWTQGPFGLKTCAMGLVWREAFEGDFTCVTPTIRSLVREENVLGPSRRAP